MVEHKERGLFLVLDGADTVNGLLRQSSGSVILNLLAGRLLPEAHIIISSWLGVCPTLQEHNAILYEVQGFITVP